MKEKKKKVCFAASSGGHLEQLLMLKPLMEKYDSFLITEKTFYKVSVKDEKVYYLNQVNRKEKSCLLLMFMNVMKQLFIFFKEKPDVIITTGVLTVIPICLTAKLFRKKLIYIECFAEVTCATEAGSLLYRYAG